MKQTLSNTKKSLGRVWFRYFQLYGVTGKLATACMDIGWTQANVDAYARGHYHLVNQQTANMVKDSEPDVPDPGDLEWLASHPTVAGSGKAPRTQMYAGQKKRRPRRYRPETVALREIRRYQRSSPPRPSSTAECLRLIARLRGEQASAASWEPRPPFEAAEMD